jgi:hydrogenase maturation protein HypF
MATPNPLQRRLRVTGVVQGVGFRPYVWRLAQDQGLAGWVRNDAEGVEILVAGAAEDVAVFTRRLPMEAPPLAQVRDLVWSDGPDTGEHDAFAIRESGAGQATTMIGVDTGVCPACLAELFDPLERRYRYAFINCTHCGPRYTLTRRLPYDRAQTSMAAFPLCPTCEGEYRDPADRRFHAEPTACPVCGPRLWVADPAIPPIADAIDETLDRLQAGQIVAIKGLGGFHLACDARNPDAVQRLRERKQREEKPFAVMAANLASIAPWVEIGPDERAMIESPERPICLLRKRPGADTALPGIAPGLNWLGVMLPYTPIHWLLFHAAAGGPAGTAWMGEVQGLVLVMTSANPGGEPLVTGNAEAAERLAGIADAVLMHDRDIVVRCDDSVVRWLEDLPPGPPLGKAMAALVVGPPGRSTVGAPSRRDRAKRSEPGGLARTAAAAPWHRRGETPLPQEDHLVTSLTWPFQTDDDDRAFPKGGQRGLGSAGFRQFIRRARGYTPQAIRLPGSGPSILALGGYLKATVCVTRGDEAFVSQHIGGLDNPATCAMLMEVTDHLLNILRVAPQAVAHDLHPDFFSTRHAAELAGTWGVPTVAVQHHQAHCAAVAAESGVTGPYLGLALDGVGLGDDGTAWGGELLRLDGASYTRLGHLSPIPLPGGDRAAKEPWRMAAAALHRLGRGGEIAGRFPGQPAAGRIGEVLDRGLNCPPTTSLGRWFDAAAGLLGAREVMAYEGQAAMLLEGLAGVVHAAPMAGGWVLHPDGRLDLWPLLGRLADEPDAALGAALFHATLAEGLAAWVAWAAMREGLARVVMGGGCLLNQILSRDLVQRITALGLTPLAARQVPLNDGGLSLGQAWVAMQQISDEELKPCV